MDLMNASASCWVLIVVDLWAGFPLERRCTFIWEQYDWRSMSRNVLVLSVGIKAWVLILDREASIVVLQLVKSLVLLDLHCS